MVVRGDICYRSSSCASAFSALSVSSLTVAPLRLLSMLQLCGSLSTLADLAPLSALACLRESGALAQRRPLLLLSPTSLALLGPEMRGVLRLIERWSLFATAQAQIHRYV